MSLGVLEELVPEHAWRLHALGVWGAICRSSHILHAHSQILQVLSTLPVAPITFKFLKIIYLKHRERDKEREKGDLSLTNFPKGCKSQDCARPDDTWQSGVPSTSPMPVSGAQGLRPALTVSTGTSAGSWVQVEQLRVLPSREAGTAGCGFAHCSTMPARHHVNSVRIVVLCFF